MAFWEMHFAGVVLGGERLFSQCYHSHGGRLSCRYHRLLPMSSLPLVLSMEWRMAVALHRVRRAIWMKLLVRTANPTHFGSSPCTPVNSPQDSLWLD